MLAHSRPDTLGGANQPRVNIMALPPAESTNDRFDIIVARLTVIEAVLGTLMRTAPDPVRAQLSLTLSILIEASENTPDPNALRTQLQAATRHLADVAFGPNWQPLPTPGIAPNRPG